MKDEKKVTKTEEAKKEVQSEEEGVKLTDEELAKVSGGDGKLAFDVIPGYSYTIQ